MLFGDFQQREFAEPTERYFYLEFFRMVRSGEQEGAPLCHVVSFILIKGTVLIVSVAVFRLTMGFCAR